MVGLLVLLVDLGLYYFTKARLFYWIAVAMIVGYLSALAFVLGMYIPLIRNLL
ncbi:hypothetical protein [Gemella morbillorum]